MLESHYKQGYLIMELTEEEQEKLTAFGFTFAPATEFIAKRNEVLTQIQNRLQQRSLKSATAMSDASLASIPGYACYETLESTYSVASGMASQFPGIAEWLLVGQTWEKLNGQGGHDIGVLKLTNKAITGNKPKLFINSAIHAREYTTAPLVLDFARWLVNGYGTDADATWILDHHEVHLMLQTNPDGRKKAETGLSWRKNANQNYCGANSNSRGADLNRNFTFGWNSTNGQGSSGSACNDTYRGPSAGSEPEIQTLEAYVRSLWPDRRGPGKNDAAPSDISGIHLDIHSYSELVLWPWGDTSQAAPNGTALQTLGRKFALFNGYSPQQSIGLYPTDGTPGGPDISNLALSGNASSGVPAGTLVTLSATASDLRFSTRNGTEPTQNVTAAEYYIDKAPWESGAQAMPLQPLDGSFNGKTEGLTGSIATTGLQPGKHTAYVRARDASGTWGAVSAAFLVIGSGTPQPNYCSAASGNANDEWISQVSFGSFTRSSAASTYSDFTEPRIGQVVNLQRGSNSLRLTPQFAGTAYNEYWKVWIDLNKDGDVTDAGEELFTSARALRTVVNGNLVIPAGAATGKTRLRVAMRYNTAPVPCGTFNYGEVEDYTVNIE
ncbi:M14 family zinc carboxypeptidase [Pseudomonas anguilliseptica]|uniref:M14 family zinc carboxypeptidase n=1 Tax=Pseudomonas anguilliseptica TaxID=53406 RepID=UPI001ABF3300|nr:M14 family zinc carboxypeptidase [Pseudomonas anguilliseptica]